jgi:hypothetical protein
MSQQARTALMMRGEAPVTPDVTSNIGRFFPAGRTLVIVSPDMTCRPVDL